jgi:RNA polymerase sigma factor (TIGR02999 family)
MPEPKNSNGLNPPKIDAIQHLDSVVYEELRRLASGLRKGEKHATLTTRSLVHEAWLRLQASPELGALSPAHFKAIVAKVIRRILVEAARRRNAQKRGGGEVAFVTLSNAPAEPGLSIEEFIALHDALEELENFSPRQAQMIECRFFGDLTVPEIAEALGVSVSAIERDWRAARAWLNGKLRPRKE